MIGYLTGYSVLCLSYLVDSAFCAFLRTSMQTYCLLYCRSAAQQTRLQRTSYNCIRSEIETRHDETFLGSVMMKGRRGMFQETPHHHKRHDGQQLLMATPHQNPNPIKGGFMHVSEQLSTFVHLQPRRVDMTFDAYKIRSNER